MRGVINRVVAVSDAPARGRGACVEVANGVAGQRIGMSRTAAEAAQHSAGALKKGVSTQAIGRSRGGLTTKIHVIVDALVIR